MIYALLLPPKPLGGGAIFLKFSGGFAPSTPKKT